MFRTWPFIALRLIVYFGITAAYVLATGTGAGIGYGVGNIFADGGPEAMRLLGRHRRLRPGVAGALLDARIHPLRGQGRPYRRHGPPDRRQGRARRPGPDRLCAAGGHRTFRRGQYPVRPGPAGEGRDRRHHRPDRRHRGLPADPRPQRHRQLHQHGDPPVAHLCRRDHPRLQHPPQQPQPVRDGEAGRGALRPERQDHGQERHLAVADHVGAGLPGVPGHAGSCRRARLLDAGRARRLVVRAGDHLCLGGEVGAASSRSASPR